MLLNNLFTLLILQEVQKKWSTGSEKSTELNLDLEQVYKTSLVSGSNSVKTLSSRYFYQHYVSFLNSVLLQLVT